MTLENQEQQLLFNKAYHKSYYKKNKDKIKARSKTRYDKIRNPTNCHKKAEELKALKAQQSLVQIRNFGQTASRAWRVSEIMEANQKKITRKAKREYYLKNKARIKARSKQQYSEIKTETKCHEESRKLRDLIKRQQQYQNSKGIK